MALRRRLLALALGALGAGLGHAGTPRGVLLVAVTDLSEDDLEADGIGREVRRLRDLLPLEATQVRSASPDTVPALAALLAGVSPARLGARLPGEVPALAGRASLHGAFSDSGWATGHFGLWPLAEAAEQLAEEAMTRPHAGAAVDAARGFVRAKSKAGEPYLATVFLPRVDAPFGTGGDFPGRSWNPGVEGVSEERWSTCPDVGRGEPYVKRYKTCPKQVYQANRVHELRLVLDLIEEARDAPGGCLVVLTSSNGGESEHVDGHSRPRSRYRGLKRSLYDGGLRVPLLYQQFGGGGDTFADRAWVWDDWETLSGLDLFPTLAAMAGLPVPADVDGANAARCLTQRRCGATALARPRPLVWEWRGTAPGHCMHESPHLAIIQGRYKLLLETLPAGAEGANRTELFELTSGDFELTNLANAHLADRRAHKSLKRTQHALTALLLDWLNEVAEPPEHGPAHPGCARGLAVEDAPRSGAALASSEEPLQGIIVVLADDMGYGDISAYGGHRRQHTAGARVALEPDTPQFDALMGQGLTMSQFYANHVVCSPSRVAIMTGRLPSHSDVRFHNTLDKRSAGNRRRGVPPYLGHANPDITTMTRFFHDHDFVTGHFGKWHMSYSAPDRFEADGAFYGLDEYQVYGAAERLDRGKVRFPTARRAHETFFDNKDLLFPSYAQHAIVNRTLAFVSDRRADGRRFYVNCWIQNPHAPLNLATEYDQAAAVGLPSSANPLPHRGDGALNPLVEEYLPHQVYRALLRDHEAAFSRLVAEVERLGMGDRTLIVHTADNGPEDRAMFFTMAGSVSPFRGGKRSLYEGGVRMPFLALWPGHIPAGSLLTQPASTVDLFPTFAALAGLRAELAALNEGLQGRDLSCAWLGSCKKEGQALPEEPELFWEYRDEFLGDCLGVAPRFALRFGEYKLLLEPQSKSDHFPSESSARLREELYHLPSDPLEATNLILTQSGNPAVLAVAADLRRRLFRHLASPEHDHRLKPAGSFLLQREDATRTGFVLQERCRLGAPSPPDARVRADDADVTAAIGGANPCTGVRPRRVCRRGSQGLCVWRQGRCRLRRRYRPGSDTSA